jgi:hypothetical protein
MDGISLLISSTVRSRCATRNTIKSTDTGTNVSRQSVPAPDQVTAASQWSSLLPAGKEAVVVHFPIMSPTCITAYASYHDLQQTHRRCRDRLSSRAPLGQTSRNQALSLVDPGLLHGGLDSGLNGRQARSRSAQYRFAEASTPRSTSPRISTTHHQAPPVRAETPGRTAAARTPHGARPTPHAGPHASASLRWPLPPVTTQFAPHIAQPQSSHTAVSPLAPFQAFPRAATLAVHARPSRASADRSPRPKDIVLPWNALTCREIAENGACTAPASLS